MLHLHPEHNGPCLTDRTKTTNTDSRAKKSPWLTIQCLQCRPRWQSVAHVRPRHLLCGRTTKDTHRDPKKVNCGHNGQIMTDQRDVFIWVRSLICRSLTSGFPKSQPFADIDFIGRWNTGLEASKTRKLASARNLQSPETS